MEPLMQKSTLIALAITFISTSCLAEFKCPESSTEDMNTCQKLADNRYLLSKTSDLKGSVSHSAVTTFGVKIGCLPNSKLVSGGCEKISEKTRRSDTTLVNLVTSYPNYALQNGVDNGEWFCEYEKDSHLNTTVAEVKAYAICEYIE